MDALLTKLVAGGSVLGVITLVGWLLAKKAIDAFAAAGEAYAKRKGENLATKEDLKDAIDQLKALERTRTGIAHEDWVVREWKAVRARNLEVIHTRLYEHFEFSALVAKYHFDEMWQWDPKMMDFDEWNTESAIQLSTLQKLYYPELEVAVQRFMQKCNQLRALSRDYSVIRGDDANSREERTALNLRWPEMESEAQFALLHVSDQLAGISRELFGVSEGRG